MAKIIKDWILPIAMIVGALTYRWISVLAPLTPYLIFLMLLLTFSKISIRDIRFHRAHLWLLMIQLVCSLAIYYLLAGYDVILAQGAMLCLLAPTATAAAVITGLLGGNVGFLTAYTLFCNIAVAIAAPVWFTLTGAGAGAGAGADEMTFMQSVWLICRKVFPLLIMPLFIAAFINRFLPKVRKALIYIPKMAFYLWVAALTIVTGVIVDFLVNNQTTDLKTEIGLVIISMILCCLQFFVGRKIGRRYGDPISSGQGLGQKNTILAIWMANTWLHPLTALAPACYILWQNIINTWQLNIKKQ
ncbi:MAG: transporter [Tannerella sp.]|jgi:BASS family bile acid:Na+ symporter|nr:transporter [Tannerella sp.]